MQNAETVLNVIRNRGTRGLPLRKVYRQLFNPQLYLMAYARIYSNAGAMTRGGNQETADAMFTTKLANIIAVKTVAIWMDARSTCRDTKKNGRQALGILRGPTNCFRSDTRFVRGVLRPGFRRNRFRPQRVRHSAERQFEMAKGLNGSSSDIKGCFANIDHQVRCPSLVSAFTITVFCD